MQLMVETHEPCVPLMELNLVVWKKESRGILESGKGWMEEGRTNYSRQNGMKGMTYPSRLAPHE